MPQRFDDIFTETHAGDGVNVFEFDSRTAPSHPDKMTWAPACATISPIVSQYARPKDHVSDKTQHAWATILPGV